MDMQLLPRHGLFAATGSDTRGNPLEAESITMDIHQRAQQARGQQRQAVLNQWHPINDLAGGLGRWCFVEPGSDGPAIFYPELRQNHLALAFTNQRWMQEVVMLEPYIVFAWCPAYYVWPYCMFSASSASPTWTGTTRSPSTRKPRSIEEDRCCSCGGPWHRWT